MPSESETTRPDLKSTHSNRSVKNDLDGSNHVSTHGKLAVRPVPPAISNAEEPTAADAQSVTEGSDAEFADPALLNDSGDENSLGSFCDADETCSADPQFLRRGMSLGPDELNDFIVEFGDEIKQGAYYDEEEGDKIEVPKSQPQHIEDMADATENGETKHQEQEQVLAD